MTETEDGGDDVEDAPAPTEETHHPRRLLWFGVAVVALLLVYSFVLEPVRVRSNSMQPTFGSGAVLLIDKLTFVFRDPRRGDVIVTDDPRGSGPIVKRVVAVAGDSVGIDDGALVVNGSHVSESYIDNTGMEGFFFGPDVVPPGDVFVLGDHRADSIDSRSFGPIAVDDIDGRVIGKIWPFG